MAGHALRALWIPTHGDLVADPEGRHVPQQPVSLPPRPAPLAHTTSPRAGDARGCRHLPRTHALVWQLLQELAYRHLKVDEVHVYDNVAEAAADGEVNALIVQEGLLSV